MSTEEEIKKQGYSVVDRRGQNNPIQEKPVPQAALADASPVKERVWKSVGYVIVLNQDRSGNHLIIGRAAGLATDGEMFTADWLFPAGWQPGFDWTIDAKRRLDTFLTCQCASKVGHCQYHRRLLNGGWAKEDLDRIRDEGDRAVPEVIELLAKAEQSRRAAQVVLAPRR